MKRRTKGLPKQEENRFIQVWLTGGKGDITLMQMPQPIHRDSEIQTILLCGVTSIHSLPASNIQTQLEP